MTKRHSKPKASATIGSIVFTGGGSTGHVSKNLIVLQLLKEQYPKVQRLYIGSKKGKEAHLVKHDVATFYTVPSGKLRRYFSWQTLPDLVRAVRGVWQAFWLLGKLKPNVVFSAGGYVALPVALAAWLRRIPVVSHETDSYPGLANRIIARFAKRILLGYQSAKQYLPSEKVLYTGNPVSPALFTGSAKRARKQLGFSANKRVIVVMGGSQGAQQINELLWAIASELKDYHLVHLTGAGKGKVAKEIDHPSYRPFEYVTKEYADFLQLADVIVSRGGGNSLVEIAALGKPAIVIPLASSAGDHQRKNAQEMAQKQPHWTVLDPEEVTSETLLKSLINTLKKPLQPHPDKDAASTHERILQEVLPFLTT